MTALDEGLPKTLGVLERRLNDALINGELPRRVRRRARPIAIDWHLVPYYGQPMRSRNEIYYGKPRAGTKDFHAYATACIVQHGQRYTLALTWVRRHESKVAILRRLIARIREIGLKIKRLLLDREFFNISVMSFLRQEKLPFLMPVVIKGRKPKPGRAVTGLRWIKRQAAGWYSHTMKRGRQEVTFSVCVNYRTHTRRKDGKRHIRRGGRKQQKLLFAAWGIKGAPTAIRGLYRNRFGIESSYRQMRQARIYTCTRNPRLRLMFVAVALMLRNLWVWIHQMRLADGQGADTTLHLERLRFKRMLDWIAHMVLALFHDGTPPYVTWDP